MKDVDHNKTIEELENDFWPLVDFPTGLVEKCYLYRKISVNKLLTGQIRLLIGQDIALPILIPIAIEKLNSNMLEEGGLYPGDLLSAVISVDNNYWANNPDQKKQLVELIKKQIDSHNMEDEHFVSRKLIREISSFIAL